MDDQRAGQQEPAASHAPAGGAGAGIDAGDGAVVGQPRLVARVYDVALHVAHLYPVDFGLPFMLTCGAHYEDPDLIETLANAPCTPSVLYLMARSPLTPAFLESLAQRQRLQQGTAARLRRFAHAATQQTRARLHVGKSAFMVAVEARRADFLDILVPLAGIDVLQPWPGAPCNAFFVACNSVANCSHNFVSGLDCAEMLRQAQACVLALEPFFPASAVIGDCSHLRLAVRAAMPEVVRRMLPQCTAADVNFVAAWCTPFSDACVNLRHALSLKPATQQQVIECAVLLANSGMVDPALHVDGRSQLQYGAMTGHTAILGPLLADAQCTPEVLTAVSPQNDCVFSTLLHVARFRITPEVPDCALLVVESGKIAPGSILSLGRTAVAWAACLACPDALAALLTDPRCPDDIVHRLDIGHYTPLSMLCEGTEPDAWKAHGANDRVARCARLLADKGALARDAPADGDDCRPSHLMCQAGLPDLVGRMLADPAWTDEDWNTTDADGHTPFSAACSRARLRWKEEAFAHNKTTLSGADECVVLLAASGQIAPSIGSSDLCSHFTWAVIAGHAHVVQSMMERPGFGRYLLQDRDTHGRIPFYYACVLGYDYAMGSPFRQGYAQCARLLADYGGLPPIDDTMGGKSSLHLVCAAGLPDLLERILADPGCTAELIRSFDDKGNSAFGIACGWARATNPHTTAKEQDEYNARRSIAAELALMLIQSGNINPADTDWASRSNVHYAASAGLPDVLQALMDLPAFEPYLTIRPDQGGETPLSVAANALARHLNSSECRVPYEQCARLLASRGALYVTSPRVQGKTPAHLVCEAGLDDLLEQIVADPAYKLELFARKSAPGQSLYDALLDSASSGECAPHSHDCACQGLARCAGVLARSGKVDPWETCTKGHWADGDCYLVKAVALYHVEALAAFLEHPTCTQELLFSARTLRRQLPVMELACEKAWNPMSLETEADRAASAACVRLLAAKGFLTAGTAPSGSTPPIHLAATAMLPDLLQLVLADPGHTPEMLTAMNKKGQTALTAVLNTISEVVDQNFWQRARNCALVLARTGLFAPDVVDSDGRTHVHWAAAARQPEVLKLLLEDPRCAPQLMLMSSKDSVTPLEEACKRSYLSIPSYDAMAPAFQSAGQQCALLLADKGALDVQAYSGSKDKGPLHWAAEAGYPKLLHRILLHPTWTPFLSSIAQGERPVGSTLFASVCHSVRFREPEHDVGLLVVKEWRFCKPNEAVWSTVADCAEMLVQAGLVSPSATPLPSPYAEERLPHPTTAPSMVWWAAWAGFPKALGMLLADERCTAEVVQCEHEGTTALAIAEYLASVDDGDGDLCAARKAAYHECAALLRAWASGKAEELKEEGMGAGAGAGAGNAGAR